MQKRKIIFLFLVAAIFIYSGIAEAGLQYLPRYQGSYSGRNQSGGRDKVTITCASKGGVEKGANQTCSGAFSAGGKTCYKSCSCPSSYQYTVASHQGTGKLCASLSNACTINNVTKYSVCNLNTCSARNSSWIGESSKASYTSNNYACTSQNTSGKDGTCYVCACPSSWASGSCPANAASCSSCKAISPYTVNKFNLVSCKAGYYKNGNACTQCPAGSYCDGTNKNTCPAGSYSAAGASSCTACPAGQNSAAGASSCASCAAGTYAAAGSSTCSKCSAGTYSAAGATSCSSCSAGKYSSAGASSCSTCAAGTYSGAGASSCTSCPAGKYSSAGASSCTSCSAGTYSSAGASSCSSCSGNTYSAAGASGCKACGSGTVANSTHTSCINDTCPGGYQTAACAANQNQTGTTTTAAGTTCYACQTKELTCAEYISENKITGITMSSYSTSYIGGTLKGPKTVDYAKCKEMANPLVTVTQPSTSTLTIDSVDVKFTGKGSVDQQCVYQFEQCREEYNQHYDLGYFSDCMADWNSMGYACGDPYSSADDCCVAYTPASWYPYKGTVNKITNAKVEADYGINTCMGSTIELYGNATTTSIGSHCYTQSGGSGSKHESGKTIIKAGANVTAPSIESYLGLLQVEKGAVLNLPSGTGNNYQGGKDNNTALSIQVEGTLNASSLSFVNGPVTIHPTGILNVGKVTASNQYKGKIIYSTGAIMQIGSNCRKATSSGSVDVTSNITTPPFGSYCSAMSRPF